MLSFHSSSRAWLLLLLTWCGVITPLAAARSRGGGDAEQKGHNLEKLRSDGEAALARKDLVAAEHLFTEFYRRTRRPIGLLHLGLLAHAKGQLLDAQDLLRRFQSDPRLSPEVREEAVTEAQRILALPRPACGKVNVIGDLGALVSLDGRLLGTMPLSRPLLIAPGKHTLAIEDGAHRQQVEIDVAVGRYLEVTYARSNVALLSVEKPGALLLEQYSGLLGDAEGPLRQAIEDLLQSSGLSPLPLDVVLEQLKRPNEGACIDTVACQLKLARDSELDYVLSINLSQRAPNEPRRLRLEYLDVEVGEQAASSEQECVQCDAARSVAMIKQAVPRLVTEALRRPRGELAVKSTPAGAMVRLASRELGTTPLLKPTWSGSFEVEVTLDGYEAQRLPIVVSPGAKATLDVTLSPVVAEPPPAPPPIAPAPTPRRPRWRLGLGGGALGAGALFIGFGVGALAIDGRCIDSPPNPIAFCDQIYSTGGVGAGLTAAGGALLLSGVVLLALPPRRSPPPFPGSVPLNR